MLHKPWKYSTGPRTAEGKARSAANGHRREMDDALAELERVQQEVRDTLLEMGWTRLQLMMGGPMRG